MVSFHTLPVAGIKCRVRRLGRQHAFVILAVWTWDKTMIKPLELSGPQHNLEALDSDEKPLAQRQVKDSEKEFAERLVEESVRIWKRLTENFLATHNWTLERMALVDRNLLRLGVFEIVFEEQTAHRVSINEAVELAKNSANIPIKNYWSVFPQFVNGVLDKIASQTPERCSKR